MVIDTVVNASGLWVCYFESFPQYSLVSSCCMCVCVCVSCFCGLCLTSCFILLVCLLCLEFYFLSVIFLDYFQLCLIFPSCVLVPDFLRCARINSAVFPLSLFLILFTMPYLFSLPVTFVDFALCGMLFILNFKHQPKYLPSHLLVKPASCILPLHSLTTQG